MEAVAFLLEYEAMCESYPTCEGCPLYIPTKDDYAGCRTYILAHPGAAVNIVEQWSKDHKGGNGK